MAARTRKITKALLHLRVICCKHLHGGDLKDRNPDPYVLICLEDVEQRTSIKRGTMAPSFGEEFKFHVYDRCSIIDIEVFHGEGLKRISLGSTEFSLTTLYQDEEIEVNLPLEGPPCNGEIFLNFRAENFGITRMRGMMSPKEVHNMAKGFSTSPTLSSSSSSSSTTFPKLISAPPHPSFLTRDASNSLITEEQLRAEFDKLDVNGNGWLTKREFSRIYQSFEYFDHPPSEKQIRELLQPYTFFNTHQLSFEEFCIIMLQLVTRRI